MGKRCAYLTMDDIANFVSDADLSFAPMASAHSDSPLGRFERLRGVKSRSQ